MLVYWSNHLLIFCKVTPSECWKSISSDKQKDSSAPKAAAMTAVTKFRRNESMSAHSCKCCPMATYRPSRLAWLSLFCPPGNLGPTVTGFKSLKHLLYSAIDAGSSHVTRLGSHLMSCEAGMASTQTTQFKAIVLHPASRVCRDSM